VFGKNCVPAERASDIQTPFLFWLLEFASRDASLPGWQTTETAKAKKFFKL
jgi:hypothetical protein